MSKTEKNPAAAPTAVVLEERASAGLHLSFVAYKLH